MKYIVAACAFLVACTEEPSSPTSLGYRQNSLTSCKEMKEYVDKKIKERGLRTFTLELVDADADAKGRVAGTCMQGGKAKKLMYRRGK